MYNAHFFFTNFASKIEMRIIPVPFVFMLGNLHNNTKSAKLNSFQFYATSRNRSRQKVCLALYITSLVYDHDWKSVAFSPVFRWQSKFNEEFSFRLCRSTIHSLIFGFFEQMRKYLKEKRSSNLLHSAVLNLIMWQQVYKVVPGLKMFRRCANGSCSIVQQQNSRRKQRKRHKTWCITEQTEH